MAWGVTALVEPAWLQRLDTGLFDALARVDEHKPETPQTVLVDVDEASLAAVGQWPWPRYRVAALTSALAAAEPRAILVDFFFPEADRTSLATIRDAFQREFDLDLTFEGVPATMTDNDAFFGHVLSKAPSVGAFLLLNAPPSSPAACRVPSLALSGNPALLQPAAFDGLLCNTAQVHAGFATGGFINVHKDSDGMLRRVPLLVQYQGEWQPSIVLAAVLLANPQAALEIRKNFCGPVLHMADKRIPVNRHAQVLFRFARTLDTIPVLSALDILAQNIDPELLRDRVVLIGSSAAGLGDLHHTALFPNLPGVAAHAVLLENIFSGAHYIQPQWNRSYALLATLLSAGAVIGAFLLAGAFPTAVTVSIALAVFPALAVLGFVFLNLVLPTAAPVLAGMTLLVFLSMSFFAVEKQLARSRAERLALFKQAMLELMVGLAESRDLETGGHIKRTQLLVKALAQGLARGGRHPVLTTYYIELLHACAPLHDVGKIAIPDKILCKPGPLDQEEFAIMQQHVVYGQRIIEMLATRVQGEEILALGLELVRTHHEKWDGTGYPAGLAGRQIPLSGRIMALADVYDALTSERVYKKAMSHAEARTIILAGSGTQFDPDVVRAFLEQEQTILAVLEQHDQSEAG